MVGGIGAATGVAVRPGVGVEVLENDGARVGVPVSGLVLVLSGVAVGRFVEEREPELE